ncbi:MAG: heat-inducible transcriptional repressor HrcA [Oscillospiraceae bacterium]|nr:heat-inducible transcriptional repressor HrcA [Oscillospiraceae bacterium]
MELSQRKKKILTTVVESYIATAEPVGSKALAEVIGCSSATIRNEMAELTSMGYLEQPHTSAGRVPSPAGYRLYVNELMERQKLSEAEVEAINGRLAKKEEELEQLMSEVGQLTSSMTQYPAYALAMKPPAAVKRFDFIYVDATTFIVVALLTDNTVKNKLVHLPFSVHQDRITTLSTLFNANFTGVTEEEITDNLIRSTERAAGDTYGLVAVVASFTIEILSQAKTAPVRVAGASQLLSQPEFRDPDKAHALMNFISDGDRLLSDLPNMAEEQDGLRVTIGPENLAEELKDSSVIMASYDAGDGMRGYIGVVGPTRMDYSSVAAKLSYIAAGLSRLFAGTDAPEGLNNKLVLKGPERQSPANDPEGRESNEQEGQ